MSKSKNHIIVSVSNDLFSDQRVDKVCNTLVSLGYKVTLVGRKLPDSLPLTSKKYTTKRLRLLFKKGALFYAELNFRLFWYLLFKKHSVLLANDLDTLLANSLVSKLKKSELVYDSHEYFTEVPELIENDFARNTWLKIEKSIFPKLKNVYTVCDSIAAIYSEKYGVEVKVVRNIPRKSTVKVFKSREELGLDENKKILLLQGAGINMDRGAEEMVSSMKYLSEDYLFLIIGGGDVFPTLHKLIEQENVQDKVKILGKIPYEDLIQYTYNADLGMSMDKNTNLNSHYSLPNKIFDYIQYQTPVLSSKLVEINKIITQNGVGWVVDSHNPEDIASKISSIFENKEEYEQKKKNTIRAANELNWENEELILKKIYSNLLK